MRTLSHVGVESGEACIQLQLPSGKHATGIGVSEAAGTLWPSPRRTHRQLAEVRQRTMADDERRDPRCLDSCGGREKPDKHGGCSRSRSGGANFMSTKPATNTPNEPEVE